VRLKPWHRPSKDSPNKVYRGFPGHYKRGMYGIVTRAFLGWCRRSWVVAAISVALGPPAPDGDPSGSVEDLYCVPICLMYLMCLRRRLA